jgi:zinc protease
MIRTALVLAVFGVLTLASVLPASAQLVEWPREDPPPPLLAPDVKFPDFELRRLDNGLQVVYVGAHEQPAVNVRLVVRAGTSSDPTLKPGLAAMTAQLLDQGTTMRGAQEIAQTIDNIGGAMGVGAGTDLSYVNVLVLKDSFDLALDMLSDVARNPAYAQTEVDRQRQQVLSEMQVSYDDPAYVSSIVFGRLVYGDHPYGMPQSGTPQSLMRITRNDLIEFHRNHYLPNNAILAVVGDVSAEEAFAGVARALSDWPRGVLPTPDLTEQPPPSNRLVIVDKPGAVQTAVRVGHLALPRAHPDYLALDMAVKILGGEGGNRLGSVLRTDRSLTYSASAEMAGRQFAGDFMAQTDTRSSATAEVLRLTVDEISRMQRERVSRRELRRAKDYLAGHFPLTIETPNAIAAQVLEAILFGLELDDLERYPERINAVTEDDIQRVAREYLKPGLLSMVLVGDASTFVNDLSGVGFDSYELVPITELDLSTVDFMIAREVAQGGEAVDVRLQASGERSRLEQRFGGWDARYFASCDPDASRVPILGPS